MWFDEYTCNLSNSLIKSGDKIVLIPLERQEMPIPWDNNLDDPCNFYDPYCLPIYGTFSCDKIIDNIKIDDSIIFLKDYTEKTAEDFIHSIINLEGEDSEFKKMSFFICKEEAYNLYSNYTHTTCGLKSIDYKDSYKENYLRHFHLELLGFELVEGERCLRMFQGFQNYELVYKKDDLEISIGSYGSKLNNKPIYSLIQFVEAYNPLLNKKITIDIFNEMTDEKFLFSELLKVKEEVLKENEIDFFNEYKLKDLYKELSISSAWCQTVNSRYGALINMKNLKSLNTESVLKELQKFNRFYSSLRYSNTMLLPALNFHKTDTSKFKKELKTKLLDI